MSTAARTGRRSPWTSRTFAGVDVAQRVAHGDTVRAGQGVRRVGRDTPYLVARMEGREVQRHVGVTLVIAVVVARDQQGDDPWPHVSLEPQEERRVQHVAQGRGAAPVVEVLSERFEVDVGGVQVPQERRARLGARIAGGHRDRLDPDLMGGDVGGALPEDCRVVVRERNAAAPQSLSRARKGLRTCPVGQRVDPPRRGDVPVLAEHALRVAARGAERQDRAAGQEVVQRLLHDGVHAEPTRATAGRRDVWTSGRQDDLAAGAGPGKTPPR